MEGADSQTDPEGLEFKYSITEASTELGQSAIRDSGGPLDQLQTMSKVHRCHAGNNAAIFGASFYFLGAVACDYIILVAPRTPAARTTRICEVTVNW